MLEILHSKKPCRTIHIISLSRKKKLTFFGKLTQEEEPLIILLNSSKICFLEWLLLIQRKDQKSKKLLGINGLKVQFALTAK
jgi:hypothetical protein